MGGAIEDGETYRGNGFRWLRSPYYLNHDAAMAIMSSGAMDAPTVWSTFGGVVPALRLLITIE